MSNHEIDWQPLDLGPGINMFLNARKERKDEERAKRNSDIQAQYAQAKLQRESHQELRDQREEARKEEDDKRRHDIEARAAFPNIARQAHGDVGAANFFGSPYGLKFDQTTDLAPSQEGPEPAPTLEASRHPLGPTAGVAASLANGPSEESAEPPGHDEASEDEDSAANAMMTDELAPPPHEMPIVKVDEPINITADAHEGPIPQPSPAMPSPPPSLPMISPTNTRMWASMAGGPRFQVPQTSDTTGMGDKYDAIYKRYLEEPGVKPSDAFKAVMAEKEKDDAESGRNTRSATAVTKRIEEQQREHPDVATQEDWLNRRLNQSDINNRRSSAARTAAAGAGPTPIGVADLVGMAEAGASQQDIARKASEAHIPEKEWMQAVQHVYQNAAAGERAGFRREQLDVTDENGNPIGPAHSAKAAADLNKSNAAFDQLRTRMHALISDIKTTGDRTLTADEWQRRDALAASAAAAGRVYNGLGGTDASQKLEADILGARGTPGHGWFMGANLGVVQHAMDEADRQHQVRLNIGLRHGGGSKLAPALGGPKPGGHPSAEPIGTIKPLPDGRKMKKVGENHWEPVQ